LPPFLLVQRQSFWIHSEATLPQGWLLSISLYLYRLTMLAWALWISFALLKIIKWGWQLFSQPVLCYKLERKAKPPGAVSPSPSRRAPHPPKQSRLI